MTNKPKLLVSASTYPRWQADQEPGFVHELSKRLTKDFEVHVLCPHSKAAKTYELLDGVQVHRYKYAPEKFETLINNGGMLANIKKNKLNMFLLPLFFLAQIIALYRLCKQHNYVIIHAHWIIPQGLCIYLLSLFKQMPEYLVTSHGADLFSLKNKVFTYLKYKVLKKAKAVTVVSNSMKNHIDKRTTLNNVNVIPMGVDLDTLFCPIKKKEKNRLLFVGRLVEKKGVLDLIEALKNLKLYDLEYHLDIVGFGPDLAPAKALVNNYKLNSYITFHGPKSQKELVPFYQKAEVFIAPFKVTQSGDQEGLGLVLIEAAACQCQIICSDLNACNDVVSTLNYVTRFPSGDISALSNAIKRHITTPYKKPEMPENLYSTYNWNNVAKEYSKVLQHND